MRHSTLFGIYETVVCDKYLTRRMIAQRTGLSYSTVIKGVRLLKHAGLIVEHYMAHKSCFASGKIKFIVLDTMGDEYVCYRYNEALEEETVLSCTPNPDFPLNENLHCFVMRAISKLSVKKSMSFCLLPPNGFDRFCLSRLPDYIAVIRTDKTDAASRMRDKYYSVKLKKYLEKPVAKRNNLWYNYNRKATP